MTALRPVIVVRSSVQKPATSARRDSARIDRPATVGIVLAPCRTPAAAAPKQPFRPDRRPAIPAIKQRTKTVGRSSTVLVRRQWKPFLQLVGRTGEAGLGTLERPGVCLGCQPFPQRQGLTDGMLRCARSFASATV